MYWSCSWQGAARIPIGNRPDPHSRHTPMSVLLKQSLSGIGEPSHHPLRLRDSFGRRIPHRLRVAMDGMTDPGVGDWQEVGVALSEQGTNVSDESQGATTDGVYWFVCSNNAKQVGSFDDARNYFATFAPEPGIRSGRV